VTYKIARGLILLIKKKLWGTQSPGYSTHQKTDIRDLLVLVESQNFCHVFHPMQMQQCSFYVPEIKINNSGVSHVHYTKKKILIALAFGINKQLNT